MNQQLRASAKNLLNEVNNRVTQLENLLLEAEALQDQLHRLIKDSRRKR